MNELKSPVYYSIKMSDGMRQFGQENSSEIDSMPKQTFIEAKMMMFPTAINVTIYNSKDEWLTAQNI